jgi:hypothetical protein
VPYRRRSTPLRRDIPSTWKSDKIVTEELFREMLDVHSELFDGQLPTTMDGISVAVLDKLGIGTAYVKAQVWDEKEEGPFNPAKNGDHKEMALDMAPAMVTIVPGKDPKRTVYVNAEEYANPRWAAPAPSRTTTRSTRSCCTNRTTRRRRASSTSSTSARPAALVEVRRSA